MEKGVLSRYPTTLEIASRKLKMKLGDIRRTAAWFSPAFADRNSLK